MKAITFRRKTLLALMIAMFGFGSMAHAAGGTSGTQDRDNERPGNSGQSMQYDPANPNNTDNQRPGTSGQPTQPGQPTQHDPANPNDMDNERPGRTGQPTQQHDPASPNNMGQQDDRPATTSPAR